MGEGKVALITGSGKQRVGWHVADALARRGYAIAVHYRHSAAEALESVEVFKSYGVRAAAFQADLTNEAAVQDMVGEALHTFGRLDAVVNCAAIWEPKKFEQVTASDIRRMFDTNVLGTFLCCQQAGLAMARQSSGGCLVTIGDWATIRPYADYSAYFVSKAAIPDMTKMLAVELAARNPLVRVNCILPGPVMLPASMPAEERQRVAEATLVKHIGRPENVAQAVLSLIDNDFITGAMLHVDGGRAIYANE